MAISIPESAGISKALLALPPPARMLGATLVYALLALVSIRFFPPDGPMAVFWPASGWALGVMLLGGRQYVWSAIGGVLIAHALAKSAWPVAAGSAIGAAAGLLVAHALLVRDLAFNPRLQTMRHYRRLLIKGIVPASTLTALIGVAWLTLGGSLPVQDLFANLLLWWMGDALGILFGTPLLLIWLLHPLRARAKKRWFEAGSVVFLNVLIGQAIFLDWFPSILPNLPRKGYWLFPLVAWAAARLGRRSVLLVLGTTVVQAMMGLSANVGFLANNDTTAGLMDGWSFLVIIVLLGVSLATMLREMRLASGDLRIAATAFECQEGMIITDADMRILRVNQSFTRIMGYNAEEVLGQTTGFMRSDRHPADFYLNAWRTAREQGTWNDEVWHKRKNGEVFPQWLTASAVRDANGIITNYVVTHTDISYRKQQEAEQLAAQLAQRDALVREVHHRIKNNLQGITGLLRQFAHANPETATPINQAIGQVRSIAAIHGLQGRTAEGSVRLCELTGLIASDISSLWQVPVRVDIPSPWTPCLVAEAEAVPLALVLNELIINAVKHAQPPAGEVEVRLRKGKQADHILIRISNQGTWQASPPSSGSSRSGLQLVDSMLPHSGTQLSREQRDGMIHVTLMLEPPVISLETSRKTHAPEPDTQNPALAGG